MIGDTVRTAHMWYNVIRICLRKPGVERMIPDLLAQAERSFEAAKRLREAGVDNDSGVFKGDVCATAVTFHLVYLAVDALKDEENPSDEQIKTLCSSWSEEMLDAIEAKYTVKPKETPSSQKQSTWAGSRTL